MKIEELQTRIPGRRSKRKRAVIFKTVEIIIIESKEKKTKEKKNNLCETMTDLAASGLGSFGFGKLLFWEQ